MKAIVLIGALQTLVYLCATKLSPIDLTELARSPPIIQQPPLPDNLRNCHVTQSAHWAFFSCQEERQVALNKATDEVIEFKLPFVDKAFALTDKDDIFLLPQAETTKITVLQLDFSKLIKYATLEDEQADPDNEQPTDEISEGDAVQEQPEAVPETPVPKPLFVFLSPVHGEIKLLQISHTNSMAILVIVDTVILLEYQSAKPGKQVDPAKAVGHENGHVVAYYSDHLPNSVVSLSLNEPKLELFLIESRGYLHHLRFRPILDYQTGTLASIKVERQYWYPNGLLKGFFNVASIDDYLVLAQYTDTWFQPHGLVQIRRNREVIAELEGKDGLMMLGKYIWTSHDAAPHASNGDIIIAISSKNQAQERATQINLFKLIDTKTAPKLIFYARSVYTVNLPGWSTLSLMDGSFVWSLYDVAMERQTVRHLRMCPSNAALGQDSYRCTLCQPDSMSVLFQQSKCTSCADLISQNEQAWTLCLTHESDPDLEVLQEKEKEVFIDEIPSPEVTEQQKPKLPAEEVTEKTDSGTKDETEAFDLTEYLQIILLGGSLFLVVLIIVTVIHCVRKDVCVKRRRENVIFIDDPLKGENEQGAAAASVGIHEQKEMKSQANQSHLRNETSFSISATEVQPTQTQLLIQDSTADDPGMEMMVMHENDQESAPDGRMQIIVEDQLEDFQSDIKDKKQREEPHSPNLRRKGVATFNYQSNMNKIVPEERLFQRVKDQPYYSEQPARHLASEMKTKTPEHSHPVANSLELGSEPPLVSATDSQLTLKDAAIALNLATIELNKTLQGPGRQMKDQNDDLATSQQFTSANNYELGSELDRSVGVQPAINAYTTGLYHVSANATRHLLQDRPATAVASVGQENLSSDREMERELNQREIQ